VILREDGDQARAQPVEQRRVGAGAVLLLARIGGEVEELLPGGGAGEAAALGRAEVVAGEQLRVAHAQRFHSWPDAVASLTASSRGEVPPCQRELREAVALHRARRRHAHELEDRRRHVDRCTSPSTTTPWTVAPGTCIHERDVQQLVVERVAVLAPDLVGIVVGELLAVVGGDDQQRAAPRRRAPSAGRPRKPT
jgi:hypothetical protein